MNINWYPGHMKKAIDEISKRLNLIDIIFELIDARIPMSSKNPLIDKLSDNKEKLLIITKSDLADPDISKEWQEYYSNYKTKHIIVDLKDPQAMKQILKKSKEVTADLMEKRLEKGIQSKVIKAMIVGIPNVGKSTLINGLSGRKSASIGNRPGVTKGQQWVKVPGDIDLLDTPGVLWPKFEDRNTGINLAFTGAIKDEIMDKESLCLKLIEKLMGLYPELLIERYKLKSTDKDPLKVMDEIAINRGFIASKGLIDYTRTSDVVLDEFRKGIIGRVSLERPSDYE